MSFDPKSPFFDVVAYHANCTDGLAAAAVVLAALDHTHCGKFVPVQYGQPLPEVITRGGDSILFVDWCPEPEQIAGLQEGWKDWFVIDHHKSREWIAEKYPEHAVFAGDKCGAVLTFEWLHPGKPLPEMLLYVQDRDLWQWKLPDSRAVSAALAQEDRDVDRFCRLLTDFNAAQVIAKGEILLASRTRAAQSLASKAFRVGSDYGDGFYAVNATADMSEVCEEMLKLYPEIQVACAFFQLDPHNVQLSFRSRSHAPTWINALGMAQYFGGGGHEHAAGAKMPLKMWTDYLECVGSVILPEERAQFQKV